MQKHTRYQSLSTKVTQVDPNGLAKLYLRTHEIPAFFAAQHTYYLHLKTQHSQSRKRWLISTSLIGLIIAFFLFQEFGFGDDEGVIVIFWIIGLVISLCIIATVFGNKVNKIQQQEAKGQMLKSFFTSISEDLHPDSGLKGIIDHGQYSPKAIYKRKTSPYSGAKKIYSKFAWANLKFMLIDGTTLRLRCIDKRKEKGSTTVRFEEIGKARIAPNALLYEVLPGQHLRLRKDLCASENDLIQHAPSHGASLAKMLKESYRSQLHRRSTPHPSLRSEQPTQPETAHDLDALQELLGQSKNPLKIERLGNSTLELRYTQDPSQVPIPDPTPYLLWLDIKTDGGKKRLGIRLPLLGDAPENSRLLKANPALAHGRFAYIPQKSTGSRQLCLLSTLDWKTLSLDALISSIHQLCQVSAHLRGHTLPTKAKAYRSRRAPNEERAMFNHIAQRLPLASPPEFSEHKAKVTVTLDPNRQHTVHIRFDRQDATGNQLISLLAYCGADNPALYDRVLEENSHYGYGALGLANLGEQLMFVVGESWPADGAEAPLLTQAILQVAQKAAQMEVLLAPEAHPTDRY